MEANKVNISGWLKEFRDNTVRGIAKYKIPENIIIPFNMYEFINILNEINRGILIEIPLNYEGLKFNVSIKNLELDSEEEDNKISRWQISINPNNQTPGNQTSKQRIPINTKQRIYRNWQLVIDFEINEQTSIDELQQILEYESWKYMDYKIPFTTLKKNI